MEGCFYRISEFARKAGVTPRTVRFYDNVGLLSPSQHSTKGYRFYTEDDIFILRQILALKFLGFSLEEIGTFLKSSPLSEAGDRRLETALTQQREILIEKRGQIDAILKAILHTEGMLREGQRDWVAIASVIAGIQKEHESDWLLQNFRPDQLHQIDQLHQVSYSPQAHEKLRQRPVWTQEDQERGSKEWEAIIQEAERLAEKGAAPDGVEGQALAARKAALLFVFTQGDPDIETGFQHFWENHQKLPAHEQPFAPYLPSISDAGAQFLNQVEASYKVNSPVPPDTTHKGDSNGVR